MARDPSLAAFADRATELLLRIAREPTPALAREYDELLFHALHAIVRRRGVSLALDAARGLGRELWVPQVQPADLDAVALDVTVASLERARRTADRFDPDRGDGASWALGAAGLSYIDVVRDFYQVRRTGTALATDPQDLTDFSDEQRLAASPEQVAETRAALMTALSQLTDEERYAVLARAQYAMSYGEIASYLFGSPQETKRVDRLLQSARKKLDRAERIWNAST